MIVHPSCSSMFSAILVLVLLFLASSCKDQEVPRTASGEPVPFDHQKTLPSGHPSVQSKAALPANSIEVTVNLSPALAGKAAPDDTVFIFARAAQGPRMPLAIVRKLVKDLPVTVSLDDSVAMMPDMKMSSFPQLVVGARISRTGDAMPNTGDLEGYTAPFKSGVGGSVEVVIGTVVGGTASSIPNGR